jgi:hypothetical protein
MRMQQYSSAGWACVAALFLSNACLHAIALTAVDAAGSGLLLSCLELQLMAPLDHIAPWFAVLCRHCGVSVRLLARGTGRSCLGLLLLSAACGLVRCAVCSTAHLASSRACVAMPCLCTKPLPWAYHPSRTIHCTRSVSFCPSSSWQGLQLSYAGAVAGCVLQRVAVASLTLLCSHSCYSCC